MNHESVSPIRVAILRFKPSDEEWSTAQALRRAMDVVWSDKNIADDFERSLAFLRTLLSLPERAWPVGLLPARHAAKELLHANQKCVRCGRTGADARPLSDGTDVICCDACHLEGIGSRWPS